MRLHGGFAKNTPCQTVPEGRAQKCGTIKIIGKLFHKITDSSGTFEWKFACLRIIGLCGWKRSSIPVNDHSFIQSLTWLFRLSVEPAIQLQIVTYNVVV